MTEKINQRVRLVCRDGVARVTLAWAEGGNALDLAMATALLESARRIQGAVAAGDIRVVVLDAEGPMFSVGGDLQGFAGAADRGDQMSKVAAVMNDALDMLRRVPAPVISVITGVAAGGGIGVALIGDIVIASTTAKFKMAYTAAGLTPDCGTSWILVHRIGLPRAMDLTLTNRLIRADQAEQWGLISRLVEPDRVEQETQTISNVLLAGPPRAYAAAKNLLWQAVSADFRTQLDREAPLISRMVSSPEGREGVDAFLSKRPPQFVKT